MQDEPITDVYGRLFSYLWAALVVIVMVLVIQPLLALGLFVLAVIIAVPLCEAQRTFRMPPKTVTVKKRVPVLTSKGRAGPGDFDDDQANERQSANTPPKTGQKTPTSRRLELPLPPVPAEPVIQRKLREETAGFKR